jgi:predicted 3-demethylubiquinone-9 3-methyltransferase (glyoxalase superfamily)
VDRYWQRLSPGGQEIQCGWLKDKYGLSWQIVPAVLDKMLNDPDSKKGERVMQGMLQMKKLDIKRLEQAYGQG